MCKNNRMCANCGQPAVDESTLCADCLPEGFLRATGKTARLTEEKESLISVLKTVNKKKQIIIDDLIWHGFEQNRKILLLEKQIKILIETKRTEGIEKDNKIAKLNRQLRLLEGLIDRLRKK